jgi:hypothetical protein
MRWETTYADALAINLLDVQDNRALWDFITAVKGVDSGWANLFQNVVWLGLQKDPNDYPPLTNAIKAFKNNLQISKTGSKVTLVASFATFQGDSPDSESSTKSSSESTSTSNPRMAWRRRQTLQGS